MIDNQFSLRLGGFARDHYHIFQGRNYVLTCFILSSSFLFSFHRSLTNHFFCGTHVVEAIQDRF